MEMITLQEIDLIYSKEKENNKDFIDRILKFNSSNVTFLSEQERAFPGNKEFLESGYYNTMLKRYFFAGAHFCTGKRVLDTCSGAGWGTYIISQYAKKVDAFDLEKLAIEFCRKTWDRDNIEWFVSDALTLSDIGYEYDVALAMETIEHFTREKGEEYISKIAARIRKGGYIIGTSAFPVTVDEAEKICSTNSYHLHIFTETEMNDILRKNFSEFCIINNWMFIGRR